MKSILLIASVLASTCFADNAIENGFTCVSAHGQLTTHFLMTAADGFTFQPGESTITVYQAALSAEVARSNYRQGSADGPTMFTLQSSESANKIGVILSKPIEQIGPSDPVTIELYDQVGRSLGYEQASCTNSADQ